MVILAVILVSAQHFLLFRFLLLFGELVYPRWLGVLLLRIEILLVLCRVLLLKKWIDVRRGRADWSRRIWWRSGRSKTFAHRFPGHAR